MFAIGLDIGSSSIKGGILDLERGEIGKIAKAPFPDPKVDLPRNHFEVDLEEILNRVRVVLTDLCNSCPDAESLFVTSQMAGLVLLDETGSPATQYISWRDQRVLESLSGTTGNYFDAIRSKLGLECWEELGKECKLGVAPSLLFWLSHHGIAKKKMTPLTIGDYVLYMLTRGSVASEWTHSTGSLNLRTRDWHHDAFARLNLPDLAWPKLQSYDMPIGSANISGVDVTCYPAIGDHQCALAGVELSEDEVSINVSTGSQVSRIASSFSIGEFQQRPYFQGQLLRALTHLPAGRALTGLVELLTELTPQTPSSPDPWERISTLVAATSETDLRANITFFPGPLGEHGSFSNVRLDNLHVGDLFVAAFRNMADNYATAANRIGLEGLSRVVLSGGLVQRFERLKREVLSRFSMTSRTVFHAEETLIGLCKLGKRATDKH